MRSLAVMVAGGSTNQFVQAFTLCLAAVHAELKLRVLFRDEAVYRLTPERINQVELSAAHGDAAGVAARLRKLDLTDLHQLCRDVKASGDVRYYVCSSSLAISGLAKEQLIPEIDEIRGLPAFLLEDVAGADRVLTF